MGYHTLHWHLDSIRQQLLAMGTAVEEMIADATLAILRRDQALAERTLANDKAVDRLEMEIDEACHSVIARNHPTAVDMRMLVAAMKITADLERMGDSAVNMVQAASKLNGQPPLAHDFDLERMSVLVQAMVRGAIDAFMRRDVGAATQICQDDDAVDDAYRRAFDGLLALMSRDPSTVARGVHLVLVARNLERIADHATNVAEDVIYYVDGRDIRHPLAVQQPPT